MFYEKELLFFRSIIENCKIKTTVFNTNNIPDNLDSGIRHHLGLIEDYNTFFYNKYESSTIFKVLDIFNCIYIFIPLPDVEADTLLLIGPYTSTFTSNEDIEAKALSYSLSSSTTKIIQKYFSSVPYISDDSFLSIAINCLCEKMFNGFENFSIKQMQTDDLSDINILLNNTRIIEDTDSPLISIQMIEKAYENENKLLNAISQGLAHKAEMFFANGKPSDMLEARLTDKLRNAKNFLIVLNTLARKAVEQGGVHPIHIDSISSDFALKIEACKSTTECDELFFKIVRKYSRLVQKHSQKSYSLLVQKVITCIDTDITADLSLKTQAKLLNVNPSYLSALFKKETGVTLTEYVNKMRVERAKQFLKKGNIQIQTVAQNCGILDVNYFTKIFKKYTGVTPKEFRYQK